MDEYMGIIKLFAGNFAPNGWFYCEGQLLPIQQYTALFSLLGTTYGGNGTTTFALPDLRSRVPVGTSYTGNPPGLTPYQSGQIGGVEAVSLLQQQIPAHSHIHLVDNANATVGTPIANNSIAAPGTGSGRAFTPSLGFSTNTPSVPLNPSSIQPTGGNQPHENRQPYLGLSYIICWNGIYPSRP